MLSKWDWYVVLGTVLFAVFTLLLLGLIYAFIMWATS